MAQNGVPGAAHCCMATPFSQHTRHGPLSPAVGARTKCIVAQELTTVREQAGWRLWRAPCAAWPRAAPPAPLGRWRRAPSPVPWCTSPWWRQQRRPWHGASRRWSWRVSAQPVQVDRLCCPYTQYESHHITAELAHWCAGPLNQGVERARLPAATPQRCAVPRFPTLLALQQQQLPRRSSRRSASS